LESLYVLGTSHTPSWLLHKKQLQDIQFGFGNMLRNKTCWMAKNKKNEIVGVIFCTTVTRKNSPDKPPTKDKYLQQG
jgi:hypothetical protein